MKRRDIARRMGVLWRAPLNFLTVQAYSPVFVGAGGVLCGPPLAFILEVLEDLREEVRVRVDLQHLGAQALDDGQAAVPKALLVTLNQKGLKRVGDFIAHIGVGQVEASEEGGLKLRLAANLVALQSLATQQVHKDKVGRGDEALVLPALEQERAIYAAEPADEFARAQVLEPVASATHEVP